MTPHAHPHPRAEPLVRLPDGTVKQVSPITGTVVWTVPGRAHRPLGGPAPGRRAVEPDERTRLCAFCPDRFLETPPEKSRVVESPRGGTSVLTDVPAASLTSTVAQFRRIPNLFEIIAVDYWRANHGYVVPADVTARATAYVAEPEGRAHVLGILRTRRAAARTPGSATAGSVGGTHPEGVHLVDAEREDVQGADSDLADAIDLFAGTHDVIVARRHLVDGASFDDELAGSGTLTPAEHRTYLAFTIAALRDLYAAQRHARYVAVFQNWLRPAGASFDHLHKQLVAIDEHGPQIERELGLLRADPDLFTTAVVDHAVDHRLVVAENDHAIAVAGVGHRYPSLEVYSTSAHQLPWEHTADEVAAMSDLLHALHAATGTRVPTNEEWHHRPPRAAEAMPWRIVLKWRVSTLAGFEGGTRINVNTIDPSTMRERVVTELHRLRAGGTIAPVRIGDECAHRLGGLAYARP